MAKVNLYFKDKFKFLKDAYTNIDTYASDIRNYIDTNIPNRFKSISNLFNLVLDVVRDISTLHLLTQETAENELNIFTAQNEGNLRGLAQLTGHKPVLPISARGSVRISITNGSLKEFGRTVVLGADSIFRNTETGREYVLQREMDIKIDTASSYFFVELIEGRRKKQTFIVDGNSNLIGDKLYTLNLDDSEYIEHYILKVYVNNELWTKEDSLRDMISNSKSYIKRVGFGNQIDITFGNGISGKRLSEGDTIVVEYLTTNGESGNVGVNSNFELANGLIDIQGNGINASQFIDVSQESGFILGSNGESAEVTRAMTGFSSRSLSFARPEYLKSFLSRLSILSHVDAWTEQDDLIFNILALPKITLSSPREYLTLDESRFALTETQENSIEEMINASRRQWVSTEIVFKKPIIKKYSMFVFVDNSIIHDKLDFKYKVENVVSEIMLSKTFGDVDKDASNSTISRSDFVNALVDFPEINSVNIDIISEENELARINKFYSKSEMVIDGSVRRNKVTKVLVPSTSNPSLGLSEIGDISTKENEIPILRGAFDVYQTETTKEMLPNSGVIIFIKQNNQWVGL